MATALAAFIGSAGMGAHQPAMPAPQAIVQPHFAEASKPRFTANSSPEMVMGYIRQRMMLSGCKTLREGTPEADAYLKKYNNPEITSHAVFTSFTWGQPIGEPAYTNVIFLKGETGDGKVSNAALRIEEDHEHVHVEQYGTIATLHQTPNNGATNKCLELMNAIVARINTEKEAYAIQGWNSWLRAKTDPEVREESKSYVISADKFQEILDDLAPLNLSEEDALEQALRKAGEFAMKAISRDTGLPLDQHYARQVIREYKDSVYLSDPTSNVIYTRLGEDSRKIGSVFGVRCLDHDGEDSAAAIAARLPDEIKQDVAAFNRKHKVDIARLKTADCHIVDEGLTPRQYIRNSKHFVRIGASVGAANWSHDYAYVADMHNPVYVN